MLYFADRQSLFEDCTAISSHHSEGDFFFFFEGDSFTSCGESCLWPHEEDPLTHHQPCPAVSLATCSSNRVLLLLHWQLDTYYQLG